MTMENNIMTIHRQTLNLYFYRKIKFQCVTEIGNLRIM